MWMLRNVIFHLRQDHPLRQQQDKGKRLAKQFYLMLFEYFWYLTQLSNDTLALSLQQDRDAHKDLTALGGFTFVTQTPQAPLSAPMTVGLILLTAKTHQTFMRHKRRFDNNDPQRLQPRQIRPFPDLNARQAQQPKVF